MKNLTNTIATSIVAAALVTTSVFASPVDKDGTYLDKANKLIGALSYQDKQAYIAEFKELETKEEKAAWFKKVIVAETSVENAINYALKGAHGNEVEAYMIESGLLVENARGKLVIDNESDAYKKLDSIRNEKWDKHVGNTQPGHGIPDTGVKPIDPGFGVDPIDPGYDVEPITQLDQVNRLLAYTGRGHITANGDGTGTLLAKNGKEYTFTQEDVDAAKDEIKAYQTAQQKELYGSIDVVSYYATVGYTQEFEYADVNYYGGFKLSDVSDDVNREQQGSIIAGADVAVGFEYVKAFVGAEVDANFNGTVQVVPVAGIRGYITEDISVDIKAYNAKYELAQNEERITNVGFGINYRF